jgi:hypothetical protein
MNAFGDGSIKALEAAAVDIGPSGSLPLSGRMTELVPVPGSAGANRKDYALCYAAAAETCLIRLKRSLVSYTENSHSRRQKTTHRLVRRQVSRVPSQMTPTDHLPSSFARLSR